MLEETMDEYNCPTPRKNKIGLISQTLLMEPKTQPEQMRCSAHPEF